MKPLRLILLGLAFASPAIAQPVVVATTSVIADFVSAVGGDDIRVETLVPNDTNPMEYDAPDADRNKLADAIAVFSNGAGLEPWLDDFLEKSRYTGAHIVATDNITLLDLAGNVYSSEPTPGFDPPQPDPYAWYDPKAVAVYIENIRSALSTLVPTKAVNFRANAEAYKIRLSDLHDYATKEFEKIPVGNRKLVTSYDCFSYFARAYGFTISRVPGPAPGQVLRQAIIDRLVDMITPLRAKAVFFERGANPTAVRDIGGALGIKVITSLYGRQLGPERTPATTYLGMFRSNVDTIVMALSEPPAEAKAK